MTGFVGSYLHQLDEKGRIALPAAFRRLSGEDDLVLVHKDEPALFLYPNATWAQKATELNALMHRQPQARGSILRVLANALVVPLDKQGRILVPERLQRAAKLEGQALIVGVLDKVELWNPHLFEERTSHFDDRHEEFIRQIL